MNGQMYLDLELTRSMRSGMVMHAPTDHRLIDTSCVIISERSGSNSPWVS